MLPCMFNQQCSKKIMSVSKCCRRKGRWVIKNKRVRCLRDHMCSPNFMATSFFTLKFILCANVTFEPEGDARTPAEHWGSGSRQDVLIAQRGFLIKRLQTNDEKRLLRRRSTEGFILRRLSVVWSNNGNSTGNTDIAAAPWLTGNRRIKARDLWCLWILLLEGETIWKRHDLCALTAVHIWIQVEQCKPSSWSHSSLGVGPLHWSVHTKRAWIRTQALED